MDALVLSPGYQPMAIVSWQRAITLLFEGKVEIVEEHDAHVRSVTLEMKIPSVVRFIRAVRQKRRAVKFSRENIWARDKGRCQYCGSPVKRSEFSYDHVLPRVQGGKTEWGNIVVACDGCNQKKGGRRPEQAGMRLLSIPMKPSKVPDVTRVCLTWAPGMPVSWRAWLRDVAYWHVALEES